MDWKRAGGRIKIGPLDGTVLFPFAVCLPFWSRYTLGFLVLYVGVNLYLSHKKRRMSWVLKRFRSMLRNGVLLARPSGYWRWLRNRGVE